VHCRDYILGTSLEYEMSQIVEWFFREVFRFHRFPEYIDNDWDKHFSVHFGRSYAD